MIPEDGAALRILSPSSSWPAHVAHEVRCVGTDRSFDTVIENPINHIRASSIDCLGCRKIPILGQTPFQGLQPLTVRQGGDI